jgi:hypothetical protein
MRRDHALYVFVLALVATLGVILLAILHDPIPELLPAIAGGGVVGGLGLAHRSTP